MVRPANFGFNTQTASSNSFQNNNGDIRSPNELAQTEFDNFVWVLRENLIEVIVVNDTPLPVKPDAIFPNNWISFHEDGTIILYPMMAPNRRLERNMELIEQLKIIGYTVNKIIDLSFNEKENKFLEGTGSMVFDHANKLIFACLSPRTDKQLIEHFAGIIGYKPVLFKAFDRTGTEIYHTNVLMCVGEGFVVACLECIKDPEDRSRIESEIKFTGNALVGITTEQMENFAGNMLMLRNKQGDNLLVMSERANDALTSVQKDVLGKFARLLSIPLNTIETLGGGSARCMMAEVFLPESI